MRLAILSGVVTTAALLLGSSTALAQGAPPAAAAPSGGGGGSMDDKKIVVGGDLQFVLPLNSDFSNATGPLIGVLVHGGYRVIPALEITGRIGYLYGLSKSQGQIAGQDYSTSISDIPIFVGARYYFMEPPAGLYGAAEIGANLLSVKASVAGQSASNGATREGINLGVGYVISPDLPIDIRAQFMYLNLLGTDSGEKGEYGLGISAGYSFFL